MRWEGLGHITQVAVLPGLRPYGISPGVEVNYKVFIRGCAFDRDDRLASRIDFGLESSTGLDKKPAVVNSSKQRLFRGRATEGSL